MNDYHFIDVSHAVEAGLVTYPGLPPPVIDEFMSRKDSRANYAPGTEFHIGHVDMVANTGTYVDSPFHRYLQANDLASLPLHKLANLEGLVVRIPGATSNPGNQRVIDASVFSSLALSNRAVLINTGWSRYWKSDRYFAGHPFLTEDAAIHLRDSGAALVGIDSLNIDDTDDGRRPVHSILLQAEIPIVEHLTGLHELPDEGFRFFAVPVKMRNMGSFPVRAFGLIADPTRNDT